MTFDPAIQSILEKLTAVNQSVAKRYPGEREQRQPVHTVYGGAHLFKADTAKKLGVVALRAMEEYAPNFVLFAKALNLPGSHALPEDEDKIADLKIALDFASDEARQQQPEAWLAYTVYTRVLEKLNREPIEDFRIDFEDGFGSRSDAEEDQAAEAAAKELAHGLAEDLLPPYIGIRIKPLTEELKVRSARTLDIFLTTLLEKTGGRLPENFVVTLPKITDPAQITTLVVLFDHLENKLGLAADTLRMEFMVETTQSIFDPQGQAAIPAMLNAARGRCVAAHFGTYDYTASCDITAAYQAMDHPSCDFARHMMKVTLAGTGIWLSDGATNVMPVGPYRAGSDGKTLNEDQISENIQAVYSAWRLGYEHIRHSLKHGFYQGWDLHPAQFPIRYAACYSFFLEGLEAASERLGNFIEKAAQATLVGNVFDDAATGQGLLNYFLRALNCGAITEDEVLATGLSLEEVRSKSFAKIMEVRRNAVSRR